MPESHRDKKFVFDDQYSETLERHRHEAASAMLGRSRGNQKVGEGVESGRPCAGPDDDGLPAISYPAVVRSFASTDSASRTQ